MKVIINPYHKSVTIDGVEVVQKFINFPDALNHLASISCDYDRDSQTITDVQDVHRYVSHAIEKQYYYKHLPEFVDWFYAEQQAQLDNAISIEQQIVAANTAAQNAAISAEKAKLEAKEAKKTNQNTQQVVDNAVAKLTQAGSTLPVKSDGTDIARTLGERFADVVNVKDFGAVGDGTTDDTEAIQAALNSSCNVFIPAGEYIISATLILPSGFSSLVGESGDKIAYGEKYCGSRFRFPVLEDSYMIISESSALIKGITFIGNEKGKGTAIQAKKSLTYDDFFDTDISIIGCVFTHLKVAVEHWNRGLLFENNSVSLCTNAVTLSFDGENNQNGIGITSNEAGFRAIKICNNRFHAVTNAVVNIGEYRDNLRGLHLCNNLMDIGDTLFTGSVKNSIISNNVIDICNQVVFDFYTLSNVSIHNNIVAQDNVSGQQEPSNFVIFRDKCKYINISNNIFIGSSANTISVNSGIDVLVMTANVFRDVCSSGVTTRAAINFAGNSNYCIISENVFMMSNSNQFAVRCNSEVLLANSIVKNNTTNGAGYQVFGDTNDVQ